MLLKTTNILKIMKPLNLIIVTFAILIAVTGCRKMDFPENEKSLANQGVAFSIFPGEDPNGLKSGNTLDCFSEQADYAIVQIDNSSDTITISYVGGIPYTTTLQLSVGYHLLKEFTIWDDNNTPNNLNDDWLLAATPHSGSNFAPYVANPLNISFVVESFIKTELGIEVICFEEDSFNEFGFTNFQIAEITVLEESFIGDICVKDINDYLGSLYAQQTGGLKLDMSAICKIEVWRNGVCMGEFSNAAWFGEGQPLKVRYADRESVIDHFEFKLTILVRKGTGFQYVYFHSWFVDDDDQLPQGSDGVVDFVLGSCVPDADVVLPSWINLPATCIYKIVGPNAPGSLGGYVDAQLTGIPFGYDIHNGIEASWCADHSLFITAGVPYNMNVHSSLYPNLMPFWAKNHPWSCYNWLMNHLDWYPGYLWSDLQGALWLFDTPPWNGVAHAGIPALTPMMQQMHDDALLYGANYKVPTGGWAAVVFTPAQQSPPILYIQTMFIKIDP
ncbi:MAG: hypothetical protein ABIJ04_08255 [Bacteroidota bacterium]